MKLPSPTELQFLALVAPREQSGRDVARLYREETGSTVSYGTLYTTFRRLKEQGWVSSRDDEDEDGRVRFFRISALGQRALREGRAFYAGLSTFGATEGLGRT